MRRRFFFAIELILLSAIILVTRCANFRDVFVNEKIYFVDGDCYARMTRARICFEHPGRIIRRHDFENFPEGTSPHTTAPLDYLIAATAASLSPFTNRALDLAGAIISPLIAIALGIFLCWWTRRIAMRFRFALLGLYAASPILAHGTALGRPDHQSLLIALIAVALCAEWMLWKSPARSWAIVCGASWALAIWVSLYEPLILFATATPIGVIGAAWGRERRGIAAEKRTKWILFAAVIAVASIIERRLPAWPSRESIAGLQNWSRSIGELARVPLNSRAWFEWCGWLLALAPLLFWPRRRGHNAPWLIVALLPATFVLTMVHARWSYFFALVFALLVPEIVAVFRNRVVAWSLFLVALFPVLQAWDRRFSEPEMAARAESRVEKMELRAIASQINAPFLAPWWFSPALSYWSRQPAVAGSSHESIDGIRDCAKFYAITEPDGATAICARRKVEWIVSYDAERVAENAARLLDSPISPSALCYVLDRAPSRVPRFLHLQRQTARFKLYRVAN